MISRRRFLLTAVFVCQLLHAARLGADQLQCPPVAPSQDQVTVCAVRQEKDGPLFKAHIRSKINYRSYTLWADEATYNDDTGEVTLEGHVILDGGPENEHIQATHGTYNVRTEAGRFYDAVGTIGFRPHPNPGILLTTTNPFAFTGKVVDKLGPDHYVVHEGIITSCELPHPKWQFNSHRTVVTPGDNALIYSSTFRIRGLPIFYFPFATHPVRRVRKSGFLMPNFGISSSKGTIFGDSFYWAINRSMDAEIGLELFSRRGWAQIGDFRARPSDRSYLNVAYYGVVDRGVGSPPLQEGGEQAWLTGQDRFTPDFRGVADVNYLSSFLFRIAFSQFFNQVVISEVKSRGFLSKNTDGFFYNALAEHYQNFESTTAGDVITILHLPSFEFSSVDRQIGRSPFYLDFDTALDGLSRSEPSFRTGHLVARLDLNPSVSLPMLFGGWSLRPEVGIRDTAYSQQLVPSSSGGMVSNDAVNRKALETSVELRPPSIQRIFDREIFGHKLKHVVEPRIIYRRVVGVDNFGQILRFDDRDILSDTNEVEYGVVNRLFTKRRNPKTDCNKAALLADESSLSPLFMAPWEQSGDELQTLSTPWEQSGAQLSKTGKCPAEPPVRDLIDWELAQKYFVDPTFGGALVNGSRNVFTTTVDFAGIAFLTSPRRLSPLISRLRIQPGSNVDAEWDLDYDFKGGRINASTVVVNYHLGQFSIGGGDAYLQAPNENSSSTTNAEPSLFHQFRMQLGYGHSNKRGFSAAGNFGYDAIQGLLQYSAIQASYNWDCCGITAEYRRFALGSVRDDHQYLFTYSLANVGSFGNLLRWERLY